LVRPQELLRFTTDHKTLDAVLADQELASLGDAYVNLLYSLYLSMKTRSPTGGKVDNLTLSKALIHSGLRGKIASRSDRHKQADAAEALLVFAWLQGVTTIMECLGIMLKQKSSVRALGSLLAHAYKKLNL